MDLLEIAAITYLFILLFNRKYQDGYSQSSAGIQSDNHMSPTGTSTIRSSNQFLYTFISKSKLNKSFNGILSSSRSVIIVSYIVQVRRISGL